MGAPATFGAFTPGIAKEYTASTIANVISTAGDATLSVADPSANATGHLVNGAFSLPQPLQGLGVVKTYAAPVSNDAVTVDVQAGDRCERRTPHRHLLEDAHLHALHHEPVAVPGPRRLTAAGAPGFAPPGEDAGPRRS